MSYVFKNEEIPITDSTAIKIVLNSVKDYDNKNEEIIIPDYGNLFIYQFWQNILKEYELFNPSEIHSFVLKNDDFIAFFQEMNPILKDFFKFEKYILKIVESDEKKIGLYILMDYSKNNPKDIVSKLMEFNSQIRPLKRKFNLINKFFVDVESI